MFKIFLLTFTIFFANLFATNKTDILTQEEYSYLKEKKQIKMCVLPNWLPFEQIDKNGNHKGIAKDIIDLISKQINTPIILIHTKQWTQSLENIKNRKCDILPVAMNTKSRRNSMNFTNAYTSEPFVIATKLDQLFIKDSKAIGNRKIGIVKGYAFIEVLKNNNPKVQIVEVQNVEEGLQKVRKGELFGYIDIMAAIGYNMQKHRIVDLKIAGKLEFNVDLSIASRNDEPLLNTIMQKSLNQISEEQLNTIVNRWIEIKVDQGIDFARIAYALAFFIIVFMLILYKNRSIQIMNKKLIQANKDVINQQEMVNKYVLILTTDLNGIITHANEAYCKTLGFSESELIGKTHSIMKHSSTTSEYIAKMWEVISNDFMWEGQITNFSKDKKIKHFNIYIESLFHNGKKIGYRSISEDITAKYLSEELNKYQKGLLSLFDKGDVVLFKWKNNKNKDVEYASESIYKLTGYKNSEFTSGEVDFTSLVNKKYLEEIRNKSQEALSNKSKYFKREPYVIKTKDEREKWILENVVTLNNSEGEITEFIAYLTDITEHVIQQRMMFQQSRTAAVGEMIGNIAHQWRQPLSVISTASTGLKLSLEFDEEINKEQMKETLSKINHHTQHLSKTIDDFRGFFKDDVSSSKNTNLKDTLKKVRELSIDSFNSNFIQYEEKCEDIYFDYNENILIQALLNIYNNAKDAFSTVQHEKYFYVSIKKEEKAIILKFRDNAGGIKDNAIEHIFDPYFTTKHESIGTGIGLYMTNQIITKQIHGFISVKNVDTSYNNETNKGAQFTIKIPIV
ncbi:PAS domain S-box protein [Arcobacter peruensis]|uniref:PAS domain S-box protein n=1 Tax=Arcobacter peruensis TaxID=2320140 RepID=UPI000F08049A|nr:transporter substrate-binding domain-containing protein [Arcobacter peruensis]